MKMLTAIAMLILSISAIASSQTKTFHFDGSQSSALISLRAEETHTEYRYEQRWGVCYRTIVDYQTVCSGGPVPQCHTRPVYRQVPYSCMQTVQIPYQVKDYDVEATVNLNISALPGATHGETFKATLNGDQLSLSATSTGTKYFVMLNKQEISSSINGSVKFIDASYDASFVEAAPIVKALSMTNISLKNSVLSFKMGPVASREHIAFNLHVEEAPILGSNTTIFNRELAASEIQLSSLQTGSAADVNIQGLGVKLSSGRYAITAKAFFKHAGTILNGAQFEATSASRTLIYKIR